MKSLAWAGAAAVAAFAPNAGEARAPVSAPADEEGEPLVDASLEINPALDDLLRDVPLGGVAEA